MDERRQFERFEISIPVRVEIPEPKGQTGEFTLEALNLSAGGVLLQWGDVMPAGLPVKMEIMLHFEELKTAADPDGALVIAVTGQVQRSGPEGTAIVFHDDYDVTTSLDFLEKVSAGPEA